MGPRRVGIDEELAKSKFAEVEKMVFALFLLFLLFFV